MGRLDLVDPSKQERENEYGFLVFAPPRRERQTEFSEESIKRRGRREPTVCSPRIRATKITIDFRKTGEWRGK